MQSTKEEFDFEPPFTELPGTVVIIPNCGIYPKYHLKRKTMLYTMLIVNKLKMLQILNVDIIC